MKKRIKEKVFKLKERGFSFKFPAPGESTTNYTNSDIIIKPNATDNEINEILDEYLSKDCLYASLRKYCESRNSKQYNSRQCTCKKRKKKRK